MWPNGVVLPELLDVGTQAFQLDLQVLQRVPERNEAGVGGGGGVFLEAR